MPDFIAGEDVLDRLRGGYRPTEAEAGQWNMASTVDRLRRQLGEPDLKWILPVIAETDGTTAAFYLALLQPFATKGDVRNLLARRFETAGPYLKSQLLWRLLDDPDLPAAMHETLFRFVMADFNGFQSATVGYFGSPAGILPAALRRMADGPPSKRWIYLCCLPQYADDQYAVKGLLAIGADSAERFTAQVARTLMEQFFCEP